MKRQNNEILGKFISWLCLKTIKLVCLIVLLIVISTVMYESYNDEIKWRIWATFESEYEERTEEFMEKNGIIDQDEGIINFDEERSTPVNI